LAHIPHLWPISLMQCFYRPIISLVDVIGFDMYNRCVSHRGDRTNESCLVVQYCVSAAECNVNHR